MRKKTDTQPTNTNKQTNKYKQQLLSNIKKSCTILLHNIPRIQGWPFSAAAMCRPVFRVQPDSDMIDHPARKLLMGWL